ncbi:MAG: hypothetical protein E5V89_18130 [Mesorhizobium sp.]|nr:MAG: hypothetical protein E5V89_18130 [Mesorhizobium sp.]
MNRKSFLMPWRAKQAGFVGATAPSYRRLDDLPAGGQRSPSHKIFERIFSTFRAKGKALLRPIGQHW